MRRVVVTLLMAAAVAGCRQAPETPAQASPPDASSAQAAAASVTLPADVTALAVAGGPSGIAAGMANGHVAVWNARDDTALILTPHKARVLAVATSPDGADVWSVAADGTLVRSSTRADATDQERPIGPAGRESPVRQLELGKAATRAAAFSPDASLLVTGGEFGDLRVYDTATGALRHVLRGHRTELQALAVRPGGTLVASASAEADLRLWDASEGRDVRALEIDLSLFALAFSPHDGTLASGGVDRRVTLRDARVDAIVATIPLTAPEMVASLAWSPDGRWLAVGDIDELSLAKGGLRLVDAASRATVARLDTAATPQGALAFTADGQRLVGGSGRALRAWSVAPGR